MTESAASPRPARGSALTLYVVVGVVASVLTVLGFSRTWFFRWTHDLEPLTPLVHAHGATMVAWYVLFLMQAWSAATGRMAMHHRLGRLGWGALVAALATGVPTLFHGIEAGNTPVPPAPFLAISALLFLQFAALASAGLLTVHRPDTHRRLMLLALLSTLSPALTRLPWAWLQIGFPLSIVLWANALPFAALFWDRWRNRRFHPALVAAGLLHHSPPNFFAARIDSDEETDDPADGLRPKSRKRRHCGVGPPCAASMESNLQEAGWQRFESSVKRRLLVALNVV